jgi:putative oxidoreductase
MTPSGIVATWASWSPQILSLIRIVSALIFITSGTMKLFSFPSGMPEGFTLVPFSQIWIGAWLELVGGALVLVGLFTRPAAFILSGTMAVAYFQFHAPTSFWPTVNQGIPAILYCFLFLYLSSAGPGPWSVDAMGGRIGASSGGQGMPIQS